MKNYSSESITNSQRKTNKSFVSLNEETHTIPEWSKILGINKKTLYARKRAGYSDKEILSKENIFDKKIKQKIIQYDLNNKELARFDSIQEASKTTGIPNSIIWKLVNGYIKKSKYPYFWKYLNIDDNLKIISNLDIKLKKNIVKKEKNYRAKRKNYKKDFVINGDYITITRTSIFFSSEFRDKYLNKILEYIEFLNIKGYLCFIFKNFKENKECKKIVSCNSNGYIYEKNRAVLTNIIREKIILFGHYNVKCKGELFITNCKLK